CSLYTGGGGGKIISAAFFWFFRVSFLIYNTFIINVKNTGNC
ncbi:MAG: hypothetical protein ACI9YB_002923, partial [Halioglobus sp.]